MNQNQVQIKHRALTQAALNFIQVLRLQCLQKGHMVSVSDGLHAATHAIQGKALQEAETLVTVAVVMVAVTSPRSAASKVSKAFVMRTISWSLLFSAKTPANASMQ